MSGVRISCDRVVEELFLHAARFFGGGSREIGRLDLTAQLPLAGDPLAHVLNRRQRSDDGSLEAEGNETGVLRDLASGRDPARKEVAVKRVREESGLAGERGAIVRLESPGHELGKGREERTPDHLRGAEARVRLEPPVPAADDQRVVGRENPLRGHLVEPLQESAHSADPAVPDSDPS